MPKVKVPRKSTSIDMTAMCDVAFLLLSFFILATQFKPDEALEVVTPKSVSTRQLEGKDIVLVTMDRDGKVYFSIDDNNQDEKEVPGAHGCRKTGLHKPRIFCWSSFQPVEIIPANES
jgi:biopolymer transport protein ExbD